MDSVVKIDLRKRKEVKKPKEGQSIVARVVHKIAHLKPKKTPTGVSVAMQEALTHMKT